MVSEGDKIDTNSDDDLGLDEAKDVEGMEVDRQNILSIVENFIEQIHHTRKILLGVSLSAMVLAPLAFALSIYLLLHPSFFVVLEIENEFGLILITMVCAVMIIASIWFATGIRQYRYISSWHKKYSEYIKRKEEVDRKIASRFGSD